jgi:DnaK suppressor protein
VHTAGSIRATDASGILSLDSLSRQNSIQSVRQYWPINCIHVDEMQRTTNRADQLPELRAILLSHRSKLTTDSRGNREVLQTPQNVAVEDQASLLHEQFVILAHHRRDRETIELIDAALERMAHEEFGICEGYDKEISLARLRAVPWARCCVPCQDHVEKGASASSVEQLLTSYS